MAWDYRISKQKLLSEAVEKALKKYLMDVVRKEEVERLIELFNDTQPVKGDKFLIQYSSALLPIEIVKEYPLRNRIRDKAAIVEYLRGKSVSVGALDSSFYSPGPHLQVPITVISVGYWFHNYGAEESSAGCSIDAESIVENRVRLQLKVKNVEKEAVNELIDKLRGSIKVLLFDESFNLSYTLSWSKDARKEFILKVKAIIDTCVKNNVIPVGVFYTTAKDISRGISTIHLINQRNSLEISDRVLMNIFLTKEGSRSPLFLIHSEAIRKHYKLVGFYLKLGERNIVRVEFPEIFKEFTDDIQEIIYFQALLGNGYPLGLQRAHEMAIITREERVLIEDVIARFLNRPVIDYILSKKASSKRWPIA